MKELTHQKLIEEYAQWRQRFGDGRNEDGLRFGQWLHSLYSMRIFTPEEDVFYVESAQEVFSRVASKIKELRERGWEVD